MSTSGRAFRCRAFARAEVSPVRRPTSQSNPNPCQHARRLGNVRRQRTKRGHPKQFQASKAGLSRALRKRMPHGGVRLATPRGSLKKPIHPLSARVPHLLLKGLRLPALLTEPVFQRGMNVGRRVARHGAQKNTSAAHPFKQHFSWRNRPCFVVLYLRHGLCPRWETNEKMKP